MGHLQLSAMLEASNDLDAVLAWHLQYNHYPPVPLTMVDACNKAIDAVLAQEPHTSIRLPNGVSYRGRSEAPAFAIVIQHHLDDFINLDEVDIDD